MATPDHQEQTARPRVAMLIPKSGQSQVLTPASMAHLHQFADIIGGDLEGPELKTNLDSLLADADVALTGWGAPVLTEAALSKATRLRLIAHSAGSVKRLIPASVYERGITVCHASNIIAEAVSEYTILVMLLGLRRVHEMDRALKGGAAWRDAFAAQAGLLSARTVGLVSAGYVGRKVRRLLQPFGPRVLFYDPYLSAEDATRLDVTSVSLATLFEESEIVSVHAPITPETKHMIGARELALLRDGALFINCGRSWTIDQDALLAKLREGKIWAALDVFDEEPLPIDSPFRSLPNALLTPHRAGHTSDSEHRQGAVIVDEIERFFTGQELQYRISPEAHARMA
jgi:phosphoglycerate dehydrogenase-like enzyme